LGGKRNAVWMPGVGLVSSKGKRERVRKGPEGGTQRFIAKKWRGVGLLDA